MNNKVIISAALTGAMTPKSVCPGIPVTPEEIAKDTVACAKAGASIVHVHVRDENYNFTMETQLFEDAFLAIKEECIKENVDIIVNLTTSNGPGTDEIRLAHLEKLRPEMCSYDAGTLNWGYAVFENTLKFLEKLGTATQEWDIKPEIEIFDATMIKNAKNLVKGGFLKTPCHYQFIMDGPGMDGTIENVAFLKNQLPEGSTWSISGIGKSHIPMMLAGLAGGADGLRVGLEDNIMLRKGVIATNEQLVERAAKLCRIVDREPATADEARAILGITRKSW